MELIYESMPRNRKTRNKCNVDFLFEIRISLISDHLGSEAVEVWMGLNQLDEDAGYSGLTEHHSTIWTGTQVPEVFCIPLTEDSSHSLNSNISHVHIQHVIVKWLIRLFKAWLNFYKACFSEQEMETKKVSHLAKVSEGFGVKAKILVNCFKIAQIENLSLP